jgi:uracil-DNA glycosylase family 4
VVSATAARAAALRAAICDCRRCPRLVEWRERVAVQRRAAFHDQEYWGRPVPGFGDLEARVVVLGLAPAAHGANRTGRMFTGDRSGDFLFAGLHRAGMASAPTSVSAGDGLELRDCFITAAVRCAPPANRPEPAERDNCSSWLADEFRLLGHTRVVLCLGAFAWDAGLRLRAALDDPAGRPRPRFAHGAEAPGRWPLLGCFHPSQQNTFTGRLTPGMLDDVLRRAREMAAQPVAVAAGLR